MKLMTEKRYVLYLNVFFAEYFVREVQSFNRVLRDINELNIIPILYTNSEDIILDVKNKLKKEL